MFNYPFLLAKSTKHILCRQAEALRFPLSLPNRHPLLYPLPLPFSHPSLPNPNQLTGQDAHAWRHMFSKNNWLCSVYQGTSN